MGGGGSGESRGVRGVVKFNTSSYLQDGGNRTQFRGEIRKHVKTDKAFEFRFSKESTSRKEMSTNKRLDG